MCILSNVQLYTVAKDGAVVVWECSFSLSEMKDYISRVRVTSSRAEGSRGEGEESMDTAAVGGGGEGEELQESSDEGTV